MRKLVMGCAVAGLIALSPKSEAGLPASLTTLPLSVRQARMEIGVASWYGEECHGNPTASGEIFDMNGLTAAHRELPLGTKVKVTNLRNKRTIILRVNDRGPNFGKRIIDVSMVAAKLLGFLRAGLTPVEVISYPKGYADQQVRLGIPFQASNQN
jgi:rare lipoprotein A